MRVLLLGTVFFVLGNTPNSTTPRHPEIMRLLVSSIGDKGADFVVFARTQPTAVKLLRQQTAHLYCLRLTKDKQSWRFFLPCGKITPMFGSTLQVTSFPDIGKIEEVLSGRPLRFRKAITLVISNIAPRYMPSVHPSSVRDYIETRLNERPQDIFMGIEVLRYGHL